MRTKIKLIHTIDDSVLKRTFRSRRVEAGRGVWEQKRWGGGEFMVMVSTRQQPE